VLQEALPCHTQGVAMTYSHAHTGSWRIPQKATAEAHLSKTWSGAWDKGTG